LTLPSLTPGALTRDLIKETSENTKKAYETILGKGQYEANVKYNNYVQSEVAKVKSQYTVTPSKKASEQYGAFENKWFWFGGDPWDVNDAIQEGAKKSPRGKLFNYVIGIVQTRGLKAKDFPLLIRAIVNAITLVINFHWKRFRFLCNG
jgi:hypothetical protein